MSTMAPTASADGTIQLVTVRRRRYKPSIVLGAVTRAVGAPLQTLAPHALLIEAETGSVLFEKGADELVAPASLAKLMTVDVVFDQLKTGKIKLTVRSSKTLKRGQKVVLTLKSGKTTKVITTKTR